MDETPETEGNVRGKAQPDRHDVPSRCVASLCLGKPGTSVDLGVKTPRSGERSPALYRAACQSATR